MGQGGRQRGKEGSDGARTVAMGGLGWRCAGVGERWPRPRGRAGWKRVSRDGRAQGGALGYNQGEGMDGGT